LLAYPRTTRAATNPSQSAAAALPDASNATLGTIRSLRTIHGNFTDKDIPDAQIEQILRASIRAANSSNMQTYSIVVVRDRDRMKQLCGYAGSCLLVYCVDYNRIKASAKSLGHAYSPDDMTSFITGSFNTAIAAQTAVIAAKSLGVDSLLTNGVHRGDMERVWKLLDLPETHCYPLIALVLGYPTEEPVYQKGRLDGPGVVHHDRYHRITKAEIDEITRRYDDRQAHLGLHDQWEAGGHKHYLDWLFREWLGRNARPAQTESQMFRPLKRSGFVDLQKS
jgi:nitroreductase